MLKHRKTGGSVFGLAIMVALVFGAFTASAAQASPVWHINGKTFKEAGISERGYDIESEGGMLTISVPEWGITVNCAEPLATGKLEGESSGTGTFYLDDCSEENLGEVCAVEPMTLRASLGLEEGGETGVIVTFTPQYTPITTLNFVGAECPFMELPLDIMNGNSESFGGELGAPEGWNAPLAGSFAYAMHGSTNGEMAAEVRLDGAFVLHSVFGEELGAW